MSRLFVLGVIGDFKVAEKFDVLTLLIQHRRKNSDWIDRTT